MIPMNRIPNNDVPPEVLDDLGDLDESAPAPETGTDVDLDLEASPGSVKAGAEVIRRFWATLPNAPGVYRMIDHRGDVLYVGKARSLKARVGSYTRGHGHSTRIARMIAETAAMEFVTTATEIEALLLEVNLIKQLKPRYNVQLRDDKSLPSTRRGGRSSPNACPREVRSFCCEEVSARRRPRASLALRTAWSTSCRRSPRFGRQISIL